LVFVINKRLNLNLFFRRMSPYISDFSTKKKSL
jgi:hypothetical protein